MTKSLIEALLTWVPVLLLIGIWIYFMRRSGALSQRQYMESTIEVMKEQLSQLKRLSEKLDRIETLLAKSAKQK